MEVVPALQRLGFAEYEARAYVALVQGGPSNGYELAKASGVPRANVYGVLDRLAARRAVLRVDEPGGTRYAAVPPAELMRRLGDEFRGVADAAGTALEALEAASEHAPVVNLRGYPALLDQARAAIGGAARTLLLAVWRPEATSLAHDVARAADRNVAITTLCMTACEELCGGCRGDVYRFRAARDDAPRRFVALADDCDVVAGEVDVRGDAQAIRTRGSVLVDVCRAAVRTSIALAATVADLGPQAETVLAPRTRALIDASANPGDDDFVTRLRALKIG
ncbi:MAG TPA: helix-turn-helix domain-containing protein [Candidatus Elarobacter sp.]